MKIVDAQAKILVESTEDLGAMGLSCRDLQNAQLAGMNCEGFIFDEADLSGANLKGANLYWASFYRTNLSHANLIDCDLRGADLKGCNLHGAILRNANLGKDNLGGVVQLQGANMEFTDLLGAILDGAQYDVDTKFPLGFRPSEHQMELVV